MWVALTGIILCFCGMEITGVHAQEVKNPQRDFPRAMLISTVIIVITMMFASLAIAIVVPKDQLSLVTGIMQAFTSFLAAYHLIWLKPIIDITIVLGGLASISNWILAPCRSLVVAMDDNDLLSSLQQENDKGSPAKLLIVQGVIVSIASCAFFLLPTVNSSYWLLTALTAQTYMLMYVMVFAAAIYLRYKRPDVKRAYQIPGKNVGIWIVSGVGIITCMFAVIIGFFPPTGLDVGSVTRYEEYVGIGLGAMLIAPFIILYVNRLGRKATH